MKIWSVTVMPACEGCCKPTNNWTTTRVLFNSHCAEEWGVEHRVVYDAVEAETLAEALVAAKNLYELDHVAWRALVRDEGHGPIIPEQLFAAVFETPSEAP